MFQKRIKFFTAILGVLFLGVFLTACGQKQADNNKLKIVTTTDFYGEVAKAVVGNKGSVQSIIDKPGIDPHDYEPTTKIAKDVSSSDITIANGLGYDSWMNKLSGKDSTSKILVGEDIMNKKTGDNPHLWYDPKTMPKLARYLAKELGKKQPKNKTYFQKNAENYIKSLKPVKSELNKLKQTAQNTSNKKVFVSEPVFDYSIKYMGFKVGNKDFEKAIENGTDPAPKVVKNMRQGISEQKISFLVYNSQSDSKTVDNMVKLANKNNIPVLKVTETLPAGKTYKEWMLSQYKNLNTILEGEE